MGRAVELTVVQTGLERGRELFARRQSDPEAMAKFETGLLNKLQLTVGLLSGSCMVSASKRLAALLIPTM